MEQIGVFLQAIPSAAASPLALIAYLATLVAWTIIALRVNRFRILMERIEALPESDRIKVIIAEMGRVKVRRGLSAEQFLRSRIHTFVFVGFLALCATVALVSGTAIKQAFFDPRARADEFTREALDQPSSTYMSAVNTLANGPQMIAEAGQDIRRPPMTKQQLDDAVDRFVQRGLDAEQINGRLAEMAGTARLRKVNDTLAKAAATVDAAFKKLADCFRGVECRAGSEFARMCNAVRDIGSKIDAINAGAKQIPGVNFNSTGTTPMLGGGSMDIEFEMISSGNVPYLLKDVCAANL